MVMKKIEAPTLEEAYKRASDEFNCSITELSYEIIQYPRNGLFGLFKRKAIIVVARKVVEDSSRAVEPGGWFGKLGRGGSKKEGLTSLTSNKEG